MSGAPCCCRKNAGLSGAYCCCREDASLSGAPCCCREDVSLNDTYCCFREDASVGFRDTSMCRTSSSIVDLHRSQSHQSTLGMFFVKPVRCRCVLPVKPVHSLCVLPVKPVHYRYVLPLIPIHSWCAMLTHLCIFIWSYTIL